jgi:hypothetical protein
MQIYGALGDARAPRHVVEPRGREPLRPELVERRCKDRLAARRGFFRTAPTLLSQRAVRFALGPYLEGFSHY